MTGCFSEHFLRDRQTRDMFIHEAVGDGNVVAQFVVDNGHKNGKEIHSVTDTAVIIISNQITGKLITKIIARPEQVKRLYRSRGEVPPRKILCLAYKHNILSYNNK